MTVHLALFAVLKGPRVPSSTTVRDLLAKHLVWARRTRSTQARDDEEPWDPEPPAEDPDPISPDEARETVTAAAIELSRAWQEDVLAGVPSRFMIALCAVADRGAYLLADAAPDLASAFARTRDVFLGHSQGGAERSDAELERALDELEALADATVQRALELNGHRARS